MPTVAHLTADDREQLAARGISGEELLRQLELLRRPARYARLERACTPGDGIERLEPADFPELLARHER
ncbi:MAG TPA: hypothetical protein VJS92_07950, partial [Candidatus Polarisedimenticolaceae bacterium]|nr:hypothetical protein [Candidatus Polarisedimenticolaceae bacterium]